MPNLSISDDVFFELLGDVRDTQLVNRPTEVRFCTRCVISNQRPRIDFDEEGVCSACRYWCTKPSINWEQRADQLSGILSTHRSKTGAYDVVVPSSGGKDSAYVAHQLRDRWGMHPLTVTWAPHLYSEIGRMNFDSFIHAGFDNIMATPNGLLHRKLSALSTVLVGDNFLPFIWGQLSFPLQVAKAYGIPLIFFGENGEAEYGGSVATQELPGMPLEDWAANYMKGVTAPNILAIGQRLGVISEREAESASRFYSPPDLATPKERPTHYWYGYFTEWRPQENYYYAAESTGFVPNPEGRSEGTYSKYASLDDRLDAYHYYLALVKFGLGRASSDAAHEVREGLITREEAVALVRRYDNEFPKRNYDVFLEYTGFTNAQFQQVLDKFRPSHLWETRNGEWQLRAPVWG